MAKKRAEQAFHDYRREEDEVVGSSNRSFGFVFAAFFLIVALIKLYFGSYTTAGVLGGGAALFLLLAVTAPGVLAPLNRIWMKIGLLLYTIMNPLTFGLIFFLLFAPIGLFMRVIGRDFLRRQLKAEETYWITREAPGPARPTMKQQF